MVEGFFPRTAFVFHHIPQRISLRYFCTFNGDNRCRPHRRGSVSQAASDGQPRWLPWMIIYTYLAEAARDLLGSCPAGSSVLCVAAARPPEGTRSPLSLSGLLASSVQLIQRTESNLAAKRAHVALLSGERANLAMASHSAANLRNFFRWMSLDRPPLSSI